MQLLSKYRPSTTTRQCLSTLLRIFLENNMHDIPQLKSLKPLQPLHHPSSNTSSASASSTKKVKIAQCEIWRVQKVGKHHKLLWHQQKLMHQGIIMHPHSSV
jgi:hypothetical protein